MYSGSFTKKILALKGAEARFNIKILGEQLELAKKSSYEFSIFNCHYVYSREIQIFLDDYLLMYARSVMPQNVAPFYKRQFRGLGARPLAEMLFSAFPLQRSPFEIAKIHPMQREYVLANEANVSSPRFLWARRSVFSAAQDLLLLTEIFSPSLIELISNCETPIHK